MIQTIVGPLLAPLATAGLVVIFVIFVLLEREDLRDRFIKLAEPAIFRRARRPSTMRPPGSAATS